MNKSIAKVSSRASQSEPRDPRRHELDPSTSVGMTTPRFMKHIFLILNSLFLIPNLVLAESLRFENPLGELGGPGVLYGRVIKNFLVPALGTAALLMFVYGGFLMISSAGNEEKAKKGQQAMYWAVVGVGVALFSYIILTFFISALTGSTNVPT